MRNKFGGSFTLICPDPWGQVRPRALLNFLSVARRMYLDLNLRPLDVSIGVWGSVVVKALRY